jgi:dienelactone hydrolase
MSQALRLLAIAGVLLFLGSAALLAQLEQAGPPHTDVALGGGIPSTLYLPESGAGRDTLREKRPREERPPGIVLMHGFSSDRLGLGTLARRLAGAGFAVLAFDVRGHGENRNPFARSRAMANSFEPEMSAAIDFMRASPLVDGARLAVIGHSMGASASLDYATRDTGIDATVLIAGGAAIMGPHRPPNALFLYAAADPERIQSRARELSARLAGVEVAELGRTYGDPARGDAVRLVEVSGADHATVVFTEAAAAEIIAWLDASFGRPARSDPTPPDPRLPLVFWNALSLLLVLPTLGFVVGRLVPRVAAPAFAGGWRELGAVALALGVTLPLAATTPLSFLSIEVGDTIVGHLSLAGIVACAALALRGALPALAGLRDPRLLGGVAVAIVFVYTLLLPLGAVVHRLTLTPERLAVCVVATLALLPFALAIQTAVRRGTPLQSLGLGLAGRALASGTMLLGVSLGLFAPVLLLMLPALVLVFLGMELLALGLYATSRNVLAIALVDSAWLCIVIAAVMPIRS